MSAWQVGHFMFCVGFGVFGFWLFLVVFGGFVMLVWVLCDAGCFSFLPFTLLMQTAQKE